MFKHNWILKNEILNIIIFLFQNKLEYNYIINGVINNFDLFLVILFSNII